MFSSNLSQRQAEIYVEGTSTARRRFLLGERKPPFELRLERSFEIEQNVTHYSSIEKLYVKVINGSILIHSYIPDSPIKLPSPVLFIKPIIETSHFILYDEMKSVYIVCPTGKVIPLPNTQAFHQSGIHYALKDSHLYIFISTTNNTIKIFEISPAGHSVRITLKQEWEHVLQNSSCITTFQYGDQWYIAASDYLEAYFAQLDFETFAEPKFYPIAPVIKLYLNNSQMLLQFVYSNATHIVWIRVDIVLIIPISTLVTRTTDARILSVPMERIVQLLHTDTSDIFTSKGLIPIIVTKYHFVFITYSSAHNTHETDMMLAISLDNGETALLKNLNFINPTSLHPGPLPTNFTIVAKQGSFIVDYANEPRPTLVKSSRFLRESAMDRFEPNNFVSVSEILFNLIDTKRLNFASKVLSKVISSRQMTPEQAMLVQYLIDEFEVLRGSNRQTLNTKFIPKKVCPELTFDYLSKVVYMLQMRAFSPVYESLEQPHFSENWADNPSALKLDMRMKHFADVIPKILSMRAEIFLPEVAIRSPSSFANSLLQWTSTEQALALRIIPQTLPFAAQRIGRDILIDILKFTLSAGDKRAASFILWALSLGPGNKAIDDEVSELLGRYNIAFPDFLMLIDCFGRSGMTKCKNVIAESSGIKFVKDDDVIVKSEDNTPDKIEEVVSQLEDVLSAVAKCTAKAGEDAAIILKENLVQRNDFTPQSQCSICGRQSSTVYSFPCGHSFDTSCLIKQLEDVLSDEEVSRMKYLIKSGDDESELEDILSQDCPLCGMLAARMISKPLNFHSYGYELL